MQVRGKETKIFDPKDGFGPLTDPVVATDSSVSKRGNRWWMYVAGPVHGKEAIQLFSASLPEGAPLRASGWTLTPSPDDPTKVELLAGQEASHVWDLKGGRHCPSYVRGWDPGRGIWVERIYYAGGAANVWGPYTIGYLEWAGDRWVDQPAPVSPEEKVFDFCVIPGQEGFEAVFSRVWLGQGTPPPTTGLWWCQAKTPSSDMSDWSTPVQIMTAEDPSLTSSR